MAEGFEPYHVPQQSRRDKLRVNPQGCVDGHILACAPLVVPLYDPSTISEDLITCAAANLHHRQGFDLETKGAGAGPKGEGMNLMGYAEGMNMISGAAAAASTASTNHHLLVDPHLSVQINPSSVQDINGGPFVYPHINYRPVPDQSFHGNEVVVYTREPNSNCAATAAASSQSLSLSLSSNHNNTNNLPLELNLHRYHDCTMFGNSKVSGGYFIAGSGSSSTQLSRSSVPLGPFTGYASVLKGSRFLKPAHQLLEELCDVGRGIFADKVAVDSSLLEPPLESLSGNGVDHDDSSLNCSDGSENTRKKSRLLSMLDEVYKRYRQYYQQMQAVFGSFESVSGLSSAAPFASLAIKAMAKHFKCLKNAIMEQLHFTNKSQGITNFDRDETQRFENLGGGTYGQRPFHSSGFVDQPVWRPQRGLPERAVTVLRAWLFEHFLHPYPTDTDKLMLAKQTGLSRNQVSNWFINARVRLWKPMVEEIHMLETRQGQKASQRDNHLPTSCSIECDNTSSSTQRNGDFSLKRIRNDLTEAPTGIEGPMNFPFNKLSHNPLFGVGMNNAGGSGAVSLTLGLRQNGMGLSDSYPITAARRFGLDAHGEEYVVGGFSAAHNRQIGGQLLHDFQDSDH